MLAVSPDDPSYPSNQRSVADAERNGYEHKLRSSDAALAALQAEAKIGISNLLTAIDELTFSKADAVQLKADLLTAVTALTASRSETKYCIAELLTSQSALASSQAETKASLSNMLVVTASLKKERADHEVDAAALVEGRAALERSKADTELGLADLLAAVTALAEAREESRHGAEDLLVAEALNTSLARLSHHLVKARDRAEHANQAKSRFLSSMSHELRTPLTSIIGYAHLLKSEGGLNDTQEMRVGAMLSSGKHLLAVIVSVLDLSEIEAEQVKLQVVEVDPNVIAVACVDSVRPSATAKGLTLGVAVAPTTPTKVHLDPTRLRQVLLNLLGNAVKFTSHGGVKLQLRTQPHGSVMRFEVVDSGPGIPADQHQRMFQAFERLDIEATSRTEGAGLGLAISSRLATLMGGRLGHDDNPGGGSVFWLELPLDAVAALPPKAAVVLEASAQVKRPLHVLVVDDVFMLRDIVGSLLRASGYKVTEAEDGAEAFAAVSSTDFDVVLMDVRMPGMDGLEATRRIRSLEGPRGLVPIIALTAHAFTNQVAECHRAGMDNHLAKPFDPDTLLAVVEQAAKLRTQRGLDR